MMIQRTHPRPSVHAPDLMPVLSRGKHRTPKKGACFMELASFLAGESWSDHPACTHPLLASLARDVNDHVDDYARTRLAPLIPEVIGLNGDDPRVDAWIAREAALAALPVAASERQGVAAVGLLRCERMLNQLEGRAQAPPRPAHPQAALDEVPHARDWARGFSALGWGSSRASPSAARRRSCTRRCPASPRPPCRTPTTSSSTCSSTSSRCAASGSRHETVPVGADQWRETVG